MERKALQWLLDAERCKKCGICVALCPRQALSADEEGKPKKPDEERCVFCRLCEYWCPDFAIRMVEGKERGKVV